MPKRLIITIVCFHVSAFISVVAGIVFVTLSSLFSGLTSAMLGMMESPGGYHFTSQLGGFWPLAVIIGLCVTVWVVGILLAIWGLKKRFYWAWVTSIVLAGLMIVGGFHNLIGLVLGGLALWGLVDPDTVATFRPSKPTTDNLKTED